MPLALHLFFVLVKHDVGVAHRMVQVSALLHLHGSSEWIADNVPFAHPLAELDDGAFLRREVKVVGVTQQAQYIEIVAQSPVSRVGARLRREVRRVYEEAHPVFRLPAVEHCAVVPMCDRDAVKVAVGAVVAGSDGVVEGFLA